LGSHSLLGLKRLYHFHHGFGSTFPGFSTPVAFECRECKRFRPIEFFYFSHPRIGSDDERVKKTDPTEFPIVPLLAERWSPVAFSARPVEQEKLNRLFEAARWAPSSSNEQPWRFIVAHKGTEGFARMADCLVEGNAWAKHAPVLMLSVASMTFARSGKPNRHGMYDTGAAVADLLVQAVAEGLVVHQMGGYDVEKARTVLQIPEHHELCAMTAIGYYGDHDKLSEKLQARENAPRQRKPQSEFVFANVMPAGPKPQQG
jgi:nitroreductase